MLWVFALIEIASGTLLFGFQWLNFTFNSSDEYNTYVKNQVYKYALPTSFGIGLGENYFMTVPRLKNSSIPATFVQIIGEYSEALLQPFPDWWTNDLSNPDGFGSISVFEIDLDLNFWLVDEAKSAFLKLDNSGKLIANYSLAGSTSENTTNIVDMALDLTRGFAYFSDMGQQGLIVLNLATNTSALVLQNHISVVPDRSLWITVNGSRVFKDDALRLGIGGIALSCDKRDLYYSPITSRNLYTVSTQYLRSGDSDLANKVINLGYKNTASKGIIISEKGNMYLSDLQEGNVYFYEQMTPYPDYFLVYFLRHVLDDKDVIWPYHITFDNTKRTLLVLANQYQNFLSGSINFEQPVFGEFNFWVFEQQADDRSYLFRCQDVVSGHSEVDIPVWIYSLIAIISLILITLMICAFKHYRMLKKRHRTFIYAS